MNSNESKAKATIVENDFDVRFKNAISAFLKNLKDNKEAYVLICTALGLVINAFWNIACGIWYKGCADELSIGMQFIYKDNQNILISVVVFLGSSVMCLPIVYAIYKFAKWIYKSVFAIIILVFLILLALNPLLLFLAYRFIEPTRAFINDNIMWFAFASILAFALTLIYLPILVALKDNDKKSSKKNTEHQDEQKPISKVVTCAKAIIVWVIAAFCFLLSIYYFAKFATSINSRYKFLVDDYNYTFTYNNNTVYENLILSETDDIYYLTACTISGDEENLQITIYPYYHTIVKKGDDDVKIVEKKIFSSSIKEGKCPAFDIAQ